MQIFDFQRPPSWATTTAMKRHNYLICGDSFFPGLRTLANANPVKVPFLLGGENGLRSRRLKNVHEMSNLSTRCVPRGASLGVDFISKISSV